MWQLSVAQFAFDHGGKQWLRDQIFGDDISLYKNPEKLLLLNFLSSNLELEMALRDIQKLKEDFAEMKGEIASLKNRVEWYDKEGRISGYLETLSERFPDFKDFVQRMHDQGVTGEALRQRLLNDFIPANSLDGMDVAMNHIHHVIMGLDSQGRKNRDSNFFHVYERLYPEQFDHSNPRDYFDSRLKVYRYYANFQMQAATLATALYRALDTGESRRNIAEVERELQANLSAQYEVFLEDMPWFAKMAVCKRLAPIIEQPHFAICSSVDRDRARPVDQMTTLNPSVPRQTIYAEDDIFSIFDQTGRTWAFQHQREGKHAFRFGVTFLAAVDGKRSGWQIFEGPPERTPAKYAANNSIIYENLRHMKLGRWLYGAARVDLDAQREAAGDFFADMFDDPVPMSEIPDASESFSVELGMMKPTYRDSGDKDTAYDQFLACRVAPESANGRENQMIDERRPVRMKPHIALVDPKGPKAFAKKAGDASEWHGAIYIEKEMDVTPAQPGACYVQEWHADLGDLPAASRGEWKPGFRVRYVVVSENRVGVGPDPAPVGAGTGTQSLADGYVAPVADAGAPVIAVRIRDTFTQSVRLMRQFEGEAEATEVSDFRSLRQEPRGRLADHGSGRARGRIRALGGGLRPAGGCVAGAIRKEGVALAALRVERMLGAGPVAWCSSRQVLTRRRRFRGGPGLRVRRRNAPRTRRGRGSGGRGCRGRARRGSGRAGPSLRRR